MKYKKSTLDKSNRNICVASFEESLKAYVEENVGLVQKEEFKNSKDRAYNNWCHRKQ